jgi:hypothetical protein
VRYLKNFGRFWYDFIVGDDWTVAAGVIVALAVTALLAHNGIGDWWLMPPAVAALLGFSLWRLVGRKSTNR